MRITDITLTEFLEWMRKHDGRLEIETTTSVMTTSISIRIVKDGKAIVARRCVSGEMLTYANFNVLDRLVTDMVEIFDREPVK